MSSCLHPDLGDAVSPFLATVRSRWVYLIGFGCLPGSRNDRGKHVVSLMPRLPEAKMGQGPSQPDKRAEERARVSAA